MYIYIMVFTAVGSGTASASATATSTLKRTIQSFGRSFTTGYAEETAEDDISLQNAVDKANELSESVALEYANELAVLRAIYRSEKRFSPLSLDTYPPLLDTTFNVTASSGAYIINGSANPTLYFIRGYKYIINVDATGHPFWIQTVSGSYSPSNIYDIGITGNGTSNGSIIIDLALDSPTLYYVCQYHSSMQGMISVIGSGRIQNPPSSDDNLYRSISPSTSSSRSTSTSTSSITNSNIIYPWQGGPIQSWLLWSGNYVNSASLQSTLYYYKKTTAPQESYQTPSNNLAGSGTFTYSDCTVPVGQGINCVVLFTGYSNVAAALNNMTNYTNGKNLFNTAYNYFKNNGITSYLISLSLGGGNYNGDWNTGRDGAIYSVYEAVTKPGYNFSYTESGTGTVYTGIGTGILNTNYNSIFFDIEEWSYPSGSTGQDFINVFNYIKKDGRSVFTDDYGNQLYEMIIIVSVAHSCSNYNGTGQDVVSTLLSDSTGSYDYISPQLYTQNTSSTTEYCANSNILWTGSNSFQSYLSRSLRYQQYGMSVILPTINLANLYTTGGTNDGSYPNLYFYQTSSVFLNPPTEGPSGWMSIPYSLDTGTVNFFNSIFGQSGSSLGGYIRYI